MTTLLWFGDSYTVGNELGYHYGSFDTHEYDDKILSLKGLDRKRGRPDLAFPMLVSKSLKLDYLLLGSGGNAITGMYLDLIGFLKTAIDNTKSYTAIFAFPTQYKRCSYIDYKGNWVNKPDKGILKHQVKYSEFETTLTINAIYSLCVANNITPYFIATWSKLDLIDDINVVPEQTWILPCDTTLVEKSWNFTDPPSTWRTLFKSNKQIYNKFIKPCGNHPNADGQQLLAETLSELLRTKLSAVP